MDPTCDVFLTNLPKNISEVVVKNLFSSAGKVLKVKIIDDKRNENQKLCFVGFETMDEALEAVRIADNSAAFGEPIKASISRKCLEGMENNQSRNNPRANTSRPQYNNTDDSSNRFANVGRGRGLQNKITTSQPSFNNADVKLSDIKLKLKELIEVEIIELNHIDYIMARPIKSTENSKIEIADLLSKINTSKSQLTTVENPKINDCYLAKWDDDCYYRAELLDTLKDGSFKISFVDEGTSGDIVKELKHIPAGPLHQYPRQFLKLSLGCPDVEELKLFVMQESEGKVVKIYWLGEFCNETVPIVNLFLNEEEVVEKYIQLHKAHIREKFSIKFDDLPIHKTGKVSNIVFIQSMYKSQDDFVLQFQDARPITLKDKKSPFVLPTPGDICIYEKRNSNVPQLFRSVIKRRQLFSFDIQLIDTGEKISNVNIDNLYTAEVIHKSDPAWAINCELEKSPDEDSIIKLLNDKGVQFTINQYKKNNRYTISFNVPQKKNFEYAAINYHDFIGKGYKVSVSHCVSPINFYIQIDREDYLQTLNDIQEKVNINYTGVPFRNIDEIHENQAVVAPFIVSGSDAEFFRAKVLEKRREAPQVHVLFVDYGNDEWVDCERLLNVDEELVAKPGLALHCQLNVDIRKEAWAHATEMFCQVVGFSDNDINEFGMQVIRINVDKLVVDLISQIKGSVTSILEKSGTCTATLDDKLSLPICNGDKKSIPRNNDISIKSNCVDVSKSNIQNNSEHDLTLKIIELEKRVSALEKHLLK